MALLLLVLLAGPTIVAARPLPYRCQTGLLVCSSQGRRLRGSRSWVAPGQHDRWWSRGARHCDADYKIHYDGGCMLGQGGGTRNLFNSSCCSHGSVFFLSQTCRKAVEITPTLAHFGTYPAGVFSLSIYVYISLFPYSSCHPIPKINSTLTQKTVPAK